MASVTPEIKKELIKKCLEMKNKAYCPYSNYTVGAALYTDTGKIYQGCNIENSSYGACNCAERTAVFKAISEGEKKILAIAITGCKRGDTSEKEEADFAWPCGICRQVLREFSSPKELIVIVCSSENKYIELKLEDLLPHSFGPEHLIES